MKKILLLAILAFGLTACQESIEERIARESAEFTQTKCPMPLDARGTMFLDSIVFDISTLTQSQYFRFDTIGMPQSQLRPVLIDELKKEPKYQLHREKGYSFHYVYRSLKDPDKILFETTLTKADY